MLPYLYSFRRCPYAIRARYTIALLACQVRLREVSLKAKPEALLALGGPSTVPQWLDEKGNRLSESWDIMQWAIIRSEKKELADQLWPKAQRERARILAWVKYNDGRFKYWLDRYKYADRYPEMDEIFYRNKAEIFLRRLNSRLSQSNYILSNKISLADIAIFPFIRQFSLVNRVWFADSDYKCVKKWLDSFIEDIFFKDEVMRKLPFWQNGQKELVFPFCQ
ncbi:glutathione S-transferase [Marinomonas sp. THO17]|uniref:glutathione S-transferase n=1 Tax=Marinomonas sp. THO17 TaxID=3149048 RepID=UPI00336BE212